MKILTALIVLLCLAGCYVPVAPSVTSGDPTKLLPASAKIVRDLGNNWVVFEIEGRQFIYRRDMPGDSRAHTEVLAPFNPQ